MTQGLEDHGPLGPRLKATTTAIIFVGLLIGLGAASNKLLDDSGIADEPGLTIDQRKEKARRNQEDWDRHDFSRSQRDSSLTPAQICAAPRTLETVKTLINDQTPNATKLANVLRDLEAARGDPLDNTIRAKEKNLQETKEMYQQHPIDPNSRYVGNPAEERAKHLADLEAELTRLRAKQAEQASRPKTQVPVVENEIIITGKPFASEFEPTLGRATCQLTFKAKGVGYENPTMQLGLPDTAVYTVQPSETDWIVNLLSLS